MEALTIDGIKRRITKILKDSGIYSPILAYQVEIVATDILIYRKMRAELLEADTFTAKEISREGHERARTSPLVTLVRKQSEIVQKGLDRLTMNASTKGGRAQARDGLASFYASLEED